MTPPEVKQRWWNAFKHEFSWDPFSAKKVRLGCQSKCSRRLTDVVSKICSKPTYRARWCARSVREEMIQIRKTDEFQKNQNNVRRIG
ncbi:1-phosphatidylinositol 4 5-bisphosphate phosphodiesterase delta-3-A [Bienertia sinuspersici]